MATDGPSEALGALESIDADGQSTAIEDKLSALWSQAQKGGSFESWTELIEYSMKQEGNVDGLRKASEAFLAKFPLCFGYWQKYALALSKSGDAEAARNTFERAVAATPYSTKLWLTYVDWLRKEGTVNTNEIRQIYERAAQYLSIEWTAHTLFDHWVAYEKSLMEDGGGDAHQVTKVLCAAAALPLKEVHRFWESLSSWSEPRTIAELVPESTVSDLRHEAKKRNLLAQQSLPAEVDGAANIVGPGMDGTLPAGGADMAAAAVWPRVGQSDAHGTAMSTDCAQSLHEDVHEASDHDAKITWLARIAGAYKSAAAGVELRRPYEERLRRRWWSPKPLPPAELLAWWEYLDRLQASEDEQMVYACFERCLVPCALYPEFWMRYLHFARTASSLPGAVQILEYALSRATAVFCPQRHDLLAAAALVQEAVGNTATAKALLSRQLAAAATTVAGAPTAEVPVDQEVNALGPVSLGPRSLALALRQCGLARRSGAPLGEVVAPLTQLIAALGGTGDEALRVHAVQQYAAWHFSIVEGKPASAQGAAVADGSGASGQSRGHDDSEASAVPNTVDVTKRLTSECPSSLAAWRTAAAALERSVPAADKATALLELYRRALGTHCESSVPGAPTMASTGIGTEDSVRTAAGDSAVTKSASQAQESLALSLAAREAIAAMAIAAMEMHGTVEQVCEAETMALSLHAEALAEATSRGKRSADWAIPGQPDAKQRVQVGMNGAASAGYDWATGMHQVQQHQQQQYAYAGAQYYQQAYPQGYFNYTPHGY